MYIYIYICYPTLNIMNVSASPASLRCVRSQGTESVQLQLLYLFIILELVKSFKVCVVLSDTKSFSLTVW